MSTIKQYKKKPIVVKAMQFFPKYEDEAAKFTKGALLYHHSTNMYYISTLEGMMKINTSDYIIQGVKGEFYAVDKDIFEETYEEVK